MDALFGQRPISLKALTDFTKLDGTTKRHLKNVYASLTLTVLAAAAGSLIHLFTSWFQSPFLATLGSLGLLLALAFTKDDGKNQMKRLGYLLGFGFFSGVGLGPLLNYAIQVEPSLIFTAFSGTTVVFVCFTVAALYAEQRTFLYLGGMLMSALSLLLMASLANLFLRSVFIFQVELYLGLLVMCGFVLYDTQLIIHKCCNGDRDYIWHSVDLFIDFINIFRRLLIILSQNEKKRRR